MSYRIDSVTDNCYEGTTCLINKFDIRDEKKLEILESHISLARISMLEKSPLQGLFDFEHYKAIHKFIFEDLYDWAGTIRTIDISKKGTVFAKADSIENLADACFMRLKENNFYKNLGMDDFVENIVDFYCVTNHIHPFREGNGRTQRAFLSQLSLNAGYEINFADIDTDKLMIATIHSANGVDTYLKETFYEIVKPIDK